MKNKLYTILETVDREQTEQLLTQTGKVRLGRRAARRMHKRLRARLYDPKRRQALVFKRVVAVAAALTVLIGGTFRVLGTDELAYQVAKAVDRLYAFVPDYGFVENTKTLRFVLAQKAQAENEKIKLCLNSAFVTDRNMTVVLTLTHKNISSEELLRQKQEEEKQPRGMPKLVLVANDARQENNDAWKEYEDFTGSSSGDGVQEQAVYCFELGNSTLHSHMQYRLFYPEQNLTLSFQLEEAKEPASPDDLDTTQCRNQISVTAIPTFSGNNLEIALYPINASAYSLYSFTKETATGSPGGEDLRVETESGVKEYQTPGGYLGPNTRFSFPIQESDRTFQLEIPFIMVQSSEFRNTRLRLPKKGEKLACNTTLEFQDCRMTIVDAERCPAEHIGDGEELKLTLRYENKAENQIMANLSVSRINFAGEIISGTAWSYLPDENGITQELYFALEESDKGSLYLQFYDPVYFLTDAYTFSFNR